MIHQRWNVVSASFLFSVSLILMFSNFAHCSGLSVLETPDQVFIAVQNGHAQRQGNKVCCQREGQDAVRAELWITASAHFPLLKDIHCVAHVCSNKCQSSGEEKARAWGRSSSCFRMQHRHLRS